MLNKVWVSNIDDNVEKLLKTRFIHESHENYQKDDLYMYTTAQDHKDNEPAMKRNEAVLKYLPG